VRSHVVRVQQTRGGDSVNYEFLHQHLRQKGFIVYPHEIVCGSEGCEHEQNRLVDVAARKDGKLYGFEYKSSADRLLRAVKQVDNYRKSFDFVVVVAEIPRPDISVNPTRGVRIKEILSQGAGLWTVQFIQKKTLWQKAELAKTMVQISQRAPIEAHEVGSDSDGKLKTNTAKWFWLFYSVLDRRSNAATFIRAKEILTEAKLFTPTQIWYSMCKVGKDETIHKIANALKSGGFSLLKDRSKGELSQPRSIVEAAEFICYKCGWQKRQHQKWRWHFDFQDLVAKNYPPKEARDMLWQDLQGSSYCEGIYGVGPRIASQFIRGMVLKGGWNFPLDDNKFLEECGFNIEMASKLGLIEDKTQFFTGLGKFADEYLNGNRGILSHVLWYMRKRYCSANLCYECPMFEHCFSHSLQWRFVEVVSPKPQQPYLKNREWVENKMLRESTKIVTLKKPPHPSQSKLSTFIG
jgi:hypothetical protein